MDLEFEYLADRPDDVPLVIQWWHTVWADRMGPDIDMLVAQLRKSLSTDELPLHLMATFKGEAIGTAALKLQELTELFPEKQYWLGSVFVDLAHRGAMVASELSLQVVGLAQKRGLPHLFLQTENLNGGLYAKLGWEPIQQFKFKGEEILLMKKQL